MKSGSPLVLGIRPQSQLHDSFLEAEVNTVCKHAKQKVLDVGEPGGKETGREGGDRGQGRVSYQALAVFCGCF